MKNQNYLNVESKDLCIEVSVIMAVYNTASEEILRVSINSILNQSVNNFELIICDDGSTDCTYETIKKITQCDHRVILIRNVKNRGSGYARNRCIAISRGEYIAIMDADDYSDQRRLEKQLEFLKSNPEYAFVGAKGKYFGQVNKNALEYYFYKEFPLKEDFLFTLPFVHGSIMFRKCILDKFNCYREGCEVIRSEDYDLLMRLYSVGYYGANLNEILYFIRIDENTFKRRKYRYRFTEFIVKLKGYKSLGLMPGGIFYALKPLIVGLIPLELLNLMKKKYYEFKS